MSDLSGPAAHWDMNASVPGYDGIPVTPDQMILLRSLVLSFPEPMSTQHLHFIKSGRYLYWRATYYQLLDLRSRNFVVQLTEGRQFADWLLGPLSDELIERGLL